MKKGKGWSLALAGGVLGLVWLLGGQAGPAAEARFRLPAAAPPPQAQRASPFTLPGSPRQFRAPQSEGTGPIYGVNFISNAEDVGEGLVHEQQYQNGLSTGATWDRWPIYWYNVEQSEGSFVWTNQDATVQADLDHGLQINAILLGTPGFYLTGAPPAALEPVQPGGTLALNGPNTATPAGLYEPVFDDGTDVPGPGKGINAGNRWARFVYNAVNRYKPGGILAQANGWAPGVGITHWEMWNEPDLPSFWDGSIPDYARLLKVGYLAARHADPSAQVLFGALANNFASEALLNFYNNVMDIYDDDPLAPANAYFHDILATHSYFYAWQSWFHVYRASNTLAARGLSKPIWLDETGVAAWDDYPGPVWDPGSAFRGTLSEQANYVIQTTFYALFAGADAVFHFQLYDGCGNQPRGTDFPPHNGELCDANGMLITNPAFPCAGDANGLFSNPTDAACFRQHPTPQSARPNLAAYQVLTTYLVDVEAVWRERPGSGDPYNGPQEWIAYYRPATKERIVGMWARFGTAETAELPASNSSALLIMPDGSTQTITPSNGIYSIILPGATNQNMPGDPNLYPIGGRPAIVVEVDAAAPLASISAIQTGGTVNVSWSADDNLGSGVLDYTVSVAVDGGQPSVWLADTTTTVGVYAGTPDHTYVFSLTARDRAGNVSAPATGVTLNLVDRLTLPFIRRLHVAP